MSFCRECGKEVQDDWITCPFCSQDIGPPASNTIGLQDSVVMGDVSINDASTKCVNCESTGVTQIACSMCKEKCYCNVCEPEIIRRRIDYEIECGWFSNFNPIHVPKFCNSCFIEKRNESCSRVCTNCKRYFDPEDPLKEYLLGKVNSSSEEINVVDYCYKCGRIEKEIRKLRKDIRDKIWNIVRIDSYSREKLSKNLKRSLKSFEKRSR
jgi:hypothetical protein